MSLPAGVLLRLGVLGAAASRAQLTTVLWGPPALQEIVGSVQTMCCVGQHVWVGFANGMLSILNEGAVGRKERTACGKRRALGSELLAAHEPVACGRRKSCRGVAMYRRRPPQRAHPATFCSPAAACPPPIHPPTPPQTHPTSTTTQDLHRHIHTRSHVAAAEGAALKVFPAHSAGIIAMAPAGSRTYTLAADGSIRGWSSCLPSDADMEARWVPGRAGAARAATRPAVVWRGCFAAPQRGRGPRAGLTPWGLLFVRQGEGFSHPKRAPVALSHS